MKISLTLANRELSFSLNHQPSTPQPSTRSTGAAAAWLRADDLDTSEGATLHSPYSQGSWVYIAISLIAETIAQIPFRIARLSNKLQITNDQLPITNAPSSHQNSQRRSPSPGGEGWGEGERSLSHGSLPRSLHSITPSLRYSLGEHLIHHGPIIDLFNHPHPTMDRALFWEMLVTWRCLRGEFFILPLDNSDQPVDLSLSRHQLSTPKPSTRISRLITLPPESFYHIIEGHSLSGWRFTGAPLTSPISSQVLFPGEVIHSRSPNPHLYWRGMSPLLLATLPASSDYAAEQFMKGLMLNNADTGIIVTTDQQVSPEQRAQTLSALRERKRRAGTADRPLFLWGGAKIERPAVTSADLQFLENRKLNRQQIGAIFKVPESLMGFTDQKNALSGGSSIEQERLNFIQNTIASHCCRIEAALAPIIRSFGHDLIGYFDLEALPAMQQARRARWEVATKAIAVGVPLNDANALFDLGLKSLPWGNTGYMPTHLQPVGTAASSSASSSASLGAPKSDEAGLPAPKSEAGLAAPKSDEGGLKVQSLEFDVQSSPPPAIPLLRRPNASDNPFAHLADLLAQATQSDK